MGGGGVEEFIEEGRVQITITLGNSKGTSKGKDLKESKGREQEAPFGPNGLLVSKGQNVQGIVFEGGGGKS